MSSGSSATRIEVWVKIPSISLELRSWPFPAYKVAQPGLITMPLGCRFAQSTARYRLRYSSGTQGASESVPIVLKM